MVNYGNAQKAILDNTRNEDNLGTDEQEAKKAAKKKDAEGTVEKLNDHLYNTMIKACEILKENMKMVAQLMTTSEFPEYEENDLKSVFTKLDNLMTGKFSLLKAIMIFAMFIQLYEVGSTDLDEVSEALRNAVEGLNFFVAASKTIQARKPEITQHNEKFLADVAQAQRFIAFALNKVAGRMISGKGSEEEKNVLSKFTILHGGIAEKFIPVLTEQCKKEIEGSFKITNDRELQAMALAPPDTLQLEENDELLLKIRKNGGADIQKLVSALQKVCGDSEQEQPDQVIEDLIRESFATMVHFQDLFDDVKNMLSFFEENEE